jgi:AcrR family transcriptional regulator
MEVTTPPGRPTATPARAGPGADERILATAYGLFSTRGVRAVGVDEIIATAGVAKATLYKYFPSKDALVLAFLDRHAQVFTREWLAAESAARDGAGPETELVEMFSLLGEWFTSPDFAGSAFINTLLEMGPGHPAGQASLGYLTEIRPLVTTRAQTPGLVEPEEFAAAFLLLIHGTIIAAAAGDPHAAARGKALAEGLIIRSRPPPAPRSESVR